MLSLENIVAMSSPLRLATIATITALLMARPSLGQTYTTCNPTQSGDCPADPALGKSISVNFASGASNDFTSQGNPTYDSNGASFTVSAGGDAPQIVSNWYIMFGKYEVTMKAAPGAGIVSSSVLQSDDLDEIDWEWLGAQNDQVQSNYFGKGQTTTYDRAAVHAVTNSQSQWHTYTVEWTETQIVWQIDGSTVRVLTASDANGQFPQTPCKLKIGAWSGGDPSNPEGTIAWAQGPTDYSDGPFTMVVQSLAVTDYSTGTQYKYGDTSGDWTSIESTGGKVNGNAGGSFTQVASPAITSTSSGNIVPFVAGQGASASATVTNTDYPGLPSGWSVNPTSGKSTSQPDSSTSQPAASQAAYCSASGYSIATGYNQQGFLVTSTVAVGVSTHWDDRGFPVTDYPPSCQTSNYPFHVGEILQPAASGQTSGTTSTTSSARLPTNLSVYNSSGELEIPWRWAVGGCTVFVISVTLAFMA